MLGSKTILYAASTFDHLRSFHLPYLQALVDAGNDVVALAGGDPRGLPARVRCTAAPFTKSIVSPHNLRVVADVARLVRRERFDLVLTHTSLAAFFVRLGVALGDPHGPRVVNTVHGYLFDEQTPWLSRSILLGAEKLAARNTDLVVTMNRQDYDLALHYGLSREPVACVDGMGVDLAGCHAVDPGGRLAARRELGVDARAFVLLYAAEFSERKNQRMLIEAMRGLPDEAVLVLPGFGNLFEECRELARACGVGERVVFPGYVGDLAPWRAAADLCVSSSRFEGLPFHMVEAAACGLPSVASRVKGHEDLVVDGVSGLLYPFGDAAAFCACVRKLMGNPTLASQMGGVARERSARYGLDRVMPRLMSLYLD